MVTGPSQRVNHDVVTGRDDKWHTKCSCFMQVNKMWTWTHLFLRQDKTIRHETIRSAGPTCPQAVQTHAAKSDRSLRNIRAGATCHPVPEDDALFLLKKNSFFDATVWFDDRWVLGTRLLVKPAIHLIRVSFLGETRMLTADFRAGQAWCLQLEGRGDNLLCRLERVPSCPIPRRIQSDLERTEEWQGQERKKSGRAPRTRRNQEPPQRGRIPR